MAVVVEGGLGVEDAQVYGVTAPFTTETFVQDLKNYWASVGYQVSGTDEEIERAGLRGFRWLENTFRDRFPGYPQTNKQGLHFPASFACDVYGITIEPSAVPVQVFQAGAEAAFRELGTPNCLTPDYTRSQQNIQSASGGPASVTYGAMAGNVSDVEATLTSVENILSRLIGDRDAQQFLLRA